MHVRNEEAYDQYYGDEHRVNELRAQEDVTLHIFRKDYMQTVTPQDLRANNQVQVTNFYAV